MRWLRYLLSALIGMLIAFGILVPAASILAPAIGREVFAIRGQSMSPTIPMGSAIVVTDVPAAEVRVGDVVTWEAANGAYVTHRVLQVVEENGELFFQTKGDANDSPDPSAVPSSSVVGVVDAWFPVAGYGLIIMSTPTGLVSWLSFGLAMLATDTLLASIIRDAEPPPPSAPRVRSTTPGLRQRLWTLRDRLRRRLLSASGTGWPIHFEGVTVLGDDLGILDDMLRCAEGDHRACVTEVRPRACIRGPAWASVVG